MNKKLLFATLSLAALAACTTDEFESQQKVAENVSPIQFEIVNDNDALTRASMDGNTVVWNANDGDLFTLYHGVTYTEPQAVTGYQNATYTAATEDGVAKLSTPSMILPGGAVMVWPVDTTFSIKSTDNLSISIPEELPAENIENHIPYVSDLIEITDEADWTNPTAAYNKAGYKRTYPIYMRPMASQLTIKANYTGADAIAALYEGADGVEEGEGIDPISATDVQLLTEEGGSTPFTTEIPLTFATPTGNQGANWNQIANNNLKQVTGVDRDNASETSFSLTTKNIKGTESAKFLILPQPALTTGVAKAAVVVNTSYGKVLVAKQSEYAASKYSDAEYNDAWYRYVSTRITTATTEDRVSATTAEPVGSENAGKFKTVATTPAYGMQQTINAFGGYTAGTGSKVIGEYMGVATTRYVNVNLSHLDMSDLHIKSDKQLRDAARVWNALGLDPVTVYLDGDANKEFEISQKTIKVINDINGEYSASNTTPKFKVQPCNVAGEECETIVVTGASDIQDVQDMAFIVYNGSKKAVVSLKAGETWKWKGDVKVDFDAVTRIRNYGTLVNAETATLTTLKFNGTANNVPLINYGKWYIDGGTLNVQFTVYNYDTVTIAKDAQYRQDGSGHKFQNQASAKPTRFGGDDSKIGVVINKGVFATVNSGNILNYGGLIEHADVDAKTYITSNQTGGNFGTAYGGSNKMGRINLPFSNKDEDNISISAAAEQGFVSVTVTSDDAPASKALDEDVVGTYVNYLIVNSGIKTINNLPAQVKYVEIADKDGKEIAWELTDTGAPVKTAQYEGLMVLSPVNIKLGTTVAATVTYLGADMYVGGVFNKTELKTSEGKTINAAATNWAGYYGDTSGNVPTKYITW